MTDKVHCTVHVLDTVLQDRGLIPEKNCGYSNPPIEQIYGTVALAPESQDADRQ